MTCKDCAHGQFRGYPPKDAPEWEVGTVYFWCPVHRHHDAESISCTHYEPGGARIFDKNGDEL